MKKILLITRPIAPPWDEASKNFAFSLAKDLNSAEDLELHLLTNGKVSELPENVVQEQIYTSNHLGFLQKARLLKLFFKKNDFDIMHFMLTPAKLNAFGFKTFLRSNKVKTIQTIATLREDLFSDNTYRKIIFADLVITYSDYAKNKLEKIGFKNVIRIYPGIDLEKYSPKQKDAETISNFNIADSDFVITYPGEYTRLGATDDIIKMLPELFEKIPNAKFVFANRIKNEKDAIKKAEVVATLTEKGIVDRVIFTDTFADMPKIYNFSDVVIFPVRNMKGKFDVPLAVIEAFACAKPVIVSNLPILKEFTSNENSIVIDPEVPGQLTNALIELFENKEKCAKIGEASRKYVVENFDINSVSKQYENAYNKLLA